MKTLEDIKVAMSHLYDGLQNGTVELKTASELANIAGKYLKAEQLQLAHQIFAHGKKQAEIAHEVKAITIDPKE